MTATLLMWREVAVITLSLPPPTTVIDDLAQFAVPAVLLSGGEPLVHPRFFDFAAYARGRGLRLTLSTNGTLIDRERARRLKELGFAYVGISLDGIGATHDYFRGRKGAFEKAVNAFRHCMAVEQKVGLRLTLSAHNVADLDRILDFIEQEDIDRVCFYHLVYSGRGASVIPTDTYVRVVKPLVAAIRAEDSQRLIIADGLRWGRDPVEGLVELGIAQSTRGYDPMRVSHHKANWVNGSDEWLEPTWPLKEGDKEWNKDRLRRERIAPWQALERRGVGVHVGEWGAHNRTPHQVVLAWMRDQMELWKEAGWGWTLWNLRGSFGILDSGRTDVAYGNFRGHKLDREMLKLLQQVG